ncbi:tyrosine-type recombinase/integrase [Gluconacetobacter tumulisoli]|uniref:Site-specific integrase n=1 Tax=Gluconacetobacter tumulisoli TaxID=1286189 RepID=A0A7W4PLL8_9PROT|nr:site-specific integrase [Gluconacetobacter tumulisoli]MBB2202270.1 site-specific integrase [Gluconacetobacter tumulisoli]
MAKLTKRSVDALKSNAKSEAFIWDGELRGFGVRVKPSGSKAFLIQYRNAENRTRRLVLGPYGVLTVEIARDMARQRLTEVAQGKDPSAERQAVRAGMTVSEICDWYLEAAEAGTILGRNRRPIKASSLQMDRSRIATHIKPLIGSRLISGLTLGDIEAMQADIAKGKSVKAAKKKGRGGRSKGGAGVASRTISTFRALLGHAARHNIIETNPATGVRQLAVAKRKRRLGAAEIGRLGATMREAMENGEHPTALAAIRLMLLTGFRRMEVLGLQAQWVSRADHCVYFPDTKSGEQVRVVGEAAIECVEAQTNGSPSRFVFPADIGTGHFIGVVRVLSRVCAQAKLEGITPHVLRHTFASIAGDLGFSELTIAGLLGHAARGVTQNYIHLDAALVVAAERVSREIATILDGGQGSLSVIHIRRPSGHRVDDAVEREAEKERMGA